MRAAALGLALLATGCFGTPTPLAPGVGGSVGAPHHGVLTEGAELPPEGTGFVRYRKFGASNWGNPAQTGEKSSSMAQFGNRGWLTWQRCC